MAAFLYWLFRTKRSDVCARRGVRPAAQLADFSLLGVAGTPCAQGLVRLLCHDFHSAHFDSALLVNKSAPDNVFTTFA